MKLGRHAAYNLIGSIVPILLSLVTVPLYLKLVGPERYGVLSIAWLLLGYFGLFDLGLGRATAFRIAALKQEPPEARAKTFWAAIWVNLLMGAVGGVVLLGVAAYFFSSVLKVGPDLRSEMLIATPVLALSVPVATLTGVLTGALQGRERFLEMNIVSTLSTALFQLFPLMVAIAIGPTLVWVLLGAVGARLLAAAVLGYFCHREITRGYRPQFDRPEAKTLLKYGGWVNLAAALGPVLYMTDRFMIGGVLGARAVADYTVPYQLATRTAVLPGALVNALFPRLSSATPEDQSVLSEKATVALICLLSPLFVGGIFLMGPFLQIWVGDQIGPEAAWVGRIILVTTWINAAALVSLTKLQAAGRPDTVSKITMLEIPVYLVMLAAGAKLFGLIGCALASAARSFLDYALLTWNAERRFPAWRLIWGQALLICGGVWVAGLWPIVDWRWWAAASVLVTVSIAFSALAFPIEIRNQLIRTLRLRPQG